uniref:DC1 domain-containing protein n=1 Tax=Ananas comosus var. bracteatus TaxID=296719 RepID=A0A6V7PXB6_ANACO|nr:unnamed protein product [Ananas comosus var. bracteatus]
MLYFRNYGGAVPDPHQPPAPLYLTDVQPQDHQLCHACRLRCGGRAYRCAPCGYSLHAACARLRRTLHHRAPGHPLPPPHPPYPMAPSHATPAVEAAQPSPSTAPLPLRPPPAVRGMPQTLTHRSHPQHPLALVHGGSGPAGYVCDLCRAGCDVSRWFYACAACDFGGHVGCFAAEALPRELYELHQQADQEMQDASSVASLQLQQQALEGRRQASDAMARIRRTAGQNAVMLTADPNQYVWRWR